MSGKEGCASKHGKGQNKKQSQVVHYAEIYRLLKCKQLINVVRVKNCLIPIGEIRTYRIDRRHISCLVGLQDRP